MIQTVQCYLPRPAADAVVVEQLRDRARAAGIAGASVEYSYYRTQGQCRITCRQEIAELLADELRAAADAATARDVREAYERALTACSCGVRRPFRGSRHSDLSAASGSMRVARCAGR